MLPSRMWRGAPGLCVLVVGAACGESPRADGAEDAELAVVAVPVAPIAGLVEALAPPDAVEVVVLIPPAANPSTYEPSLEDLRSAAEAGAYFAIGHPAFVFERTWLAGLLEGSDARRVALFDDCPVMEEDYHVWISADCLGPAARRAADALTDLLPDSGEEIAANLAAFSNRLAAADSAADARLGEYRGRPFLVLHPAWGYFAREHDLTQLEILSHGSGDPGAARLAALIERSRQAGIGVVFVQPQFNPAPARVVADALGAELVLLDPLLRDPIGILEQTSAALTAAFSGSRAR